MRVSISLRLGGDDRKTVTYKADLAKGAIPFELDEDCIVMMPCCGERTKFINLQFDGPAGFARFELPVHNPRFTEILDKDKIPVLESLLGCSLLQIRAHY